LKLALALAWLPCALLSSSVWAEVETPGAEQQPIRVERLQIVLIGETRGRGLEGLFAEWLEPAHLDVTFVERAALDARAVFAHDVDPSRIRIWVTLPAPKLARITFADPRAERFLVREVPLESSLDELGREALAQVLVAAAQAFRERRESTPRDEVMRTIDTPAERDVERRLPAPTFSDTAGGRGARPEGSAESRSEFPRPRWATGARYAVRVKGPEGVSHALGAMLEGGFEWRTARLGLSGELRYEFPHRAESQEIALSLSSLAFHAGLVGAMGSKRHGWMAEVGAGFERVSIETGANGPEDIQPRGEIRDDRALLYCGLGPFWRFGTARLGLGFRLDVPLANTHYDIVAQGTPTPVLTPWRLQPGAFVAAAWD
jgi:hypothetical protein